MKRFSPKLHLCNFAILSNSIELYYCNFNIPARISVCWHLFVCICVFVCSCVWGLEIGLVWFVSLCEAANTSKQLSTKCERVLWERMETWNSFFECNSLGQMAHTCTYVHAKRKRQRIWRHPEIKSLMREYILNFM